MRIATYNVWNSEQGMPFRNKYIIKELRKVKADVVCLQEIRNSGQAEEIAMEAGYRYCYYENYENEEEGLTILCNLPYESKICYFKDANAIACTILQDEKRFLIVNVHLPWDSEAERERQIVSIINNIKEQKCDYVIMDGDFNCTDTSDVHRFLKGECLLDGAEANPCWFDLACAYAEINCAQMECTLNFRENPRFRKNTIETNSRVDRILLRNPYPGEFPSLKMCMTFGQTIYEDIGLAASDHYGVAVEIV